MAATEKKKFKTYPANVEAEKSILGAMMIDAKVATNYMGNLTSKEFSDKSARLVFEAMQSLFNDNKPLDIVTVADKMRNLGTLEEVGDFPYLTKLTDSIPSSAGSQYYVEILKRDSLLRELLEVSKAIAEDVYTSEDGAKSLSYAQQQLLALTQGRGASALTHVGAIANEVVHTIEEQHSNPDAARGLLTGFKNLDHITNGLQKSDLIILAARPGVGKTAFALNIATNIATTQEGKNILIFSLEMADSQLVKRMLCNLSGIDNDKISKADLEMEDFILLNNARQQLGSSKIYVDQTTLQSPADILAKCHRFVMEHGSIDLIIIDYMQLMTFPGKENKQQEVAEISRRMKLIAKEINAPLIVLSQMSRTSEYSSEKPQLHDLRDSGAIEQDADIVAFLHKQKDQDPDNVIVEFLVAKFRNGQQGSLAFEWHGSNFKFVPCDISRLPGVRNKTPEGEKGAELAKKLNEQENNQGV